MSTVNDQISELSDWIKNMGKDHVKVQTAWGVVKDVDWEDKTCVVNGEMDNLPYYDVLLGLGSVYQKPTVGSKVLIGIIENQDAQAFLIQADQVSEYHIKVSGTLTISNDTESLVSLITDLLTEIRKMKFTTNAGPTIKLINSPAFLELETRFKSLLK